MNSSSAVTSINQIPALVKTLHKKGLFTSQEKNGLTVFDFGAGKKGKIDCFFEENDIGYLPYDPFNRSHSENFDSALDVEFANFLISCNVLNVIEDEYLLPVLNSIKKFTERTLTKTAFVSVYHNPKLPINRKVKDHFQRNQPLDWYVPLLENFFCSVKKSGKVLECRCA